MKFSTTAIIGTLATLGSTARVIFPENNGTFSNGTAVASPETPSNVEGLNFAVSSGLTLAGPNPPAACLLACVGKIARAHNSARHVGNLPYLCNNIAKNVQTPGIRDQIYQCLDTTCQGNEMRTNAYRVLADTCFPYRELTTAVPHTTVDNVATTIPLTVKANYTTVVLTTIATAYTTVVPTSVETGVITVVPVTKTTVHETTVYFTTVTVEKRGLKKRQNSGSVVTETGYSVYTIDGNGSSGSGSVSTTTVPASTTGSGSGSSSQVLGGMSNSGVSSAISAYSSALSSANSLASAAGSAASSASASASSSAGSAAASAASSAASSVSAGAHTSKSKQINGGNGLVVPTASLAGLVALVGFLITA